MPPLVSPTPTSPRGAGVVIINTTQQKQKYPRLKGRLGAAKAARAEAAGQQTGTPYP
jgi:hypothetical protein